MHIVILIISSNHKLIDTALVSRYAHCTLIFFFSLFISTAVVSNTYEFYRNFVAKGFILGDFERPGEHAMVRL